MAPSRARPRAAVPESGATRSGDCAAQTIGRGRPTASRAQSPQARRGSAGCSGDRDHHRLAAERWLEQEAREPTTHEGRRLAAVRDCRRARRHRPQTQSPPSRCRPPSPAGSQDHVRTSARPTPPPAPGHGGPRDRQAPQAPHESTTRRESAPSPPPRPLSADGVPPRPAAATRGLWTQASWARWTGPVGTADSCAGGHAPAY